MILYTYYTYVYIEREHDCNNGYVWGGYWEEEEEKIMIDSE
jgi:hypothetical protein